MKYSDGKDYKVIALCVAKFDEADQTEILQNLNRICKKNNYKIFVFATTVDFYVKNKNDRGEEKIFDLMDPSRFDAVVIVGTSFKAFGPAEKIAKRALDCNVPCISLVRPIEGCINVRYRFSDGFEKVVRHMVEYHKPKHINFIAGMRENYFSEERIGIFRKVLTENNIPIEEDRIDYGGFWEGPTSAVMDRFLASNKPIDCIICSNDLMAMEACRKLSEAGLRVPEDVLVSGFDGMELERYHYPRLCTAETVKEDLLEKTGEILEDIFAGKQVEDDYKIDITFRAGQSCGCSKYNYSDEQVASLGNKMFLANKHERQLISKVEQMYSKVSVIGNAGDMFSIWGEFLYFFKDFCGGDLALAFNTDFLNDRMEIWPNIRPIEMTEEHHYYTDELQVPLCYFNGSLLTPLSIERRNLIPRIDDFLSKDNVVMFLPMLVQQSTVGYMVAGFEPENFEYFMLNAVLMNYRQVIEMHKYRIDMQNLYSTDQLTKLLNRKGFYRHMESIVDYAVKENQDLAVISIDMNWLKQTNDTYGHKEGDFALSYISRTMEEVMNGHGVCTRFGGDEFAIAFSDPKADELSKSIMSEIDRRLNDFNATHEKPYPLSVSMGYVVKSPLQYKNLETYIVEADRKMYTEKFKFKEENTWEESQGNKIG